VSEASTPSASRIPLPEGTIPVAIGLLISGMSSYIFFKVGQVALGKDLFKPITALWFTTFALIPGFFIPIEQEVGRAIAHRRALGQGGAPVIKRMNTLVIGLVVLLVAITAATSPLTTNHLFDKFGIVTLAFALTFVTYAPMQMARGIASGHGRFDAYGIILGVDGGVRILACIALWALGIHNVGAFAMAVCLPPLATVVVAMARRDLGAEPGPEATFREVTPNLSWLLVGSIMGAALVNAGPIAVTVLATSAQSAKVTAFGNGVLVSRVPLFLFQAVQAALLPRLARLAARGDLAEFRDGFRKLMMIVVGVGAVGTIGAFAVGPMALNMVYGGGLDRRTLTLLALASAIYMVALAIAQAVIALQGHRLVAIGWFTAMATFVVVTVISAHDIFLRVELGLVAGSTAGMVVFLYALRSRMASGAGVDVDALIETVLDPPVE